MTNLMPMPEIKRTTEGDDPIDEAELAAAAFLARYQGRTLEAYRYDLRAFFQWAADARLDILKATRPQIELYARAMEARGLAATTIDRRLSTVCGFTASPTSTAGLPPTPPSTFADPRSTPTTPVVSTAPSSGPSYSRPSGSTMHTPPWPCSWASTASG
jgi:hypothetical protein